MPVLSLRARLGETLQTLLRVRPDELQRTAIAFVYLFASVGAFIVGRVARSVLFLEIPDYREQLPLMYVLIAVTVAVAMATYARFERKLPRHTTNAISLAVMTVITLGFRYSLHTQQHVAYWAFYIWVEVYGSFLVVQFWSMANEIFNARQAKRVFAIIGGGGVLANVAMGFAISGSVKTIGTENLTFVIAGLFLVSLLAAVWLGRSAKTELAAARGRGAVVPKGGSARVFATRHVRLIAVVVVLTYIVSTLVDYQYQVIIGDSIPGKDERSAFLGAFFGLTGIAAAVIQFAFTSRILERFGLLTALALLPAAMMTGSVSLLLLSWVPALWAVTATKGGENVLRYTVNDSTLQLLYLPIPAHIRSRVKTIIDGILKPVAIGGTGIVMAVLVGQVEKMSGWGLGVALTARQLGWVVVLALGLWLVALVWLRREYLASLLRTLQRRRLNFGEARFEVNDEATLRTMLPSIDAVDDNARGVALLQAHLADDDATMRGAAIAAMRSIVRHDPLTAVSPALISRALKAEVGHAFALLATVEDLALDEASMLLRDALEYRLRQSYDRIFGLLALKYRADTIDLVSRNLASAEAATRANAVEVFDNLLDADDKAIVVALFDDGPAAKKIGQVADLFKIVRRDRQHQLECLVSGSDAWLRVCAAYAIASWQIKELVPLLTAMLASEQALCRETALVALRRLGAMETIAPYLDGLLHDPALAVRRYAEDVRLKLQG